MPTSTARTKTRAEASSRHRQRLAPEERAGQILDFAARLIIEEGFTELSMERLAREAGISKALIYNYFPNRNDMLRALLEREMQVLRERQVLEINAATDFRDLVYRTTRTYVAQVQERGALLQRLWAESAVARTVADKHLNHREEALRYMVRLMVKEYGLPVDVATSAVDMQMAMTEAAAQHLSNSHNDVDFATNICVTLLLGGAEALAREHAKPVNASKTGKTTTPVAASKATKPAERKARASRSRG
ncbi:TetR/AcrR family transcriptional regulator [Roseateles toxinivorans]|uniref:TetR family transcriptional regulator n=1 Tax=Roseateles toxinivorans TaxID=270368 RepID=A0A4R6QI60_9BURK|nr:TetR/AcrR family transcriptional regulator [Roseateles toxinivorans]TDP61299.1 TetR family transcriptional regulator [Roseateles toxinivorans]